MAGLRASDSHSLVVPVQTAGLVDRNDLADLPRRTGRGSGQSISKDWWQRQLW